MNMNNITFTVSVPLSGLAFVNVVYAGVGMTVMVSVPLSGLAFVNHWINHQHNNSFFTVSVPLSGLAFVNHCWNCCWFHSLDSVSVPLSGLAFVNFIIRSFMEEVWKEFPSPYRG